MLIKPYTIDFETEAIKPRPDYPPKPVGFSIMGPNQRKSRYYAWGHPTENNCTFEEAREVLRDVYRSGKPLLFHNAKFDLDVAQEHFGLKPPPWHLIHDTLFLLFLADPHAKSFSLKPAAEKYLGMPPEEQEAVRDWLVDHGIVKKNDTKWGAFISKAPGKLVGRYADGDVIRTRKLFDLLYHEVVVERGMGEAYDRERKLVTIFLANEKEGIRVDTEALARDCELFADAKERADAWLRKRLRAPDLNVDSNKEFADALEKTGVVTDFVYTAKGNRSVSKENLTPEMFKDPDVASVYVYRNTIQTCLAMFMLPWLEQSAKGGRIYTSWNQVRQSHGNNLAGTRTGRLSSTPPLLNIPKAFKEEIAQPRPKGFRGKPLPHLPFVRRYILPDDSKSVWIRRDYSQQEYRILAHFEGGSLLRAYQENPKTDVHAWLQDLLKNEYSIVLDRDRVKILNFAEIYGMGQGNQAKKLNISIEQVRKILKAKSKLMTGLDGLKKEIKLAAKAGLPIVTWGGREYYAEEPRWNGHRWQTFEYKLLNYLIQGSAADCTKEAIIRYDEAKKEGSFKVAVHDELNISAPKKAWREENRILREVMQSIEFDVLMLSEGEVGPNWHDLQPIKE